MRYVLIVLLILFNSIPLCALSLEELKGEWQISDPETVWKNLESSPGFASMSADDQAKARQLMLLEYTQMRYIFAAEGVSIRDHKGRVIEGSVSNFTSTAEKTARLTHANSGMIPNTYEIQLMEDGTLYLSGADARRPGKMATLILARAVLSAPESTSAEK